jgi:hypothetical protein
MNVTLSRLRQSIEGVTRFFSEHPDKGLATDAAAEGHSPVGDAICRAVPSTMEMQID